MTLSMDYLIRKGRKTDISELVMLEKNSFKSNLLKRENFVYLLKSKSVAILVISYLTKIIGVIILLFRRNSKICRIYSLAINSSYRMHSLGTHLLKAGEKEAIKRKCSVIILEVEENNKSAIQFYKKNNFIIFGSYLRYYENGNNAWRMRKPLLSKRIE